MTNRTQLASDEILNGTILTVWLVEPADSPSPWSSCGRSDPRRSPPATIPSWRRRCADWWQMPAPSWPRSRHAGGDDHRHVSCLRSQTLALGGLSVSVRMGVSQGAGCGQRIRKRASSTPIAWAGTGVSRRRLSRFSGKPKGNGMQSWRPRQEPPGMRSVPTVPTSARKPQRRKERQRLYVESRLADVELLARTPLKYST
jgi:hypothetical protein